MKKNEKTSRQVLIMIIENLPICIQCTIKKWWSTKKKCTHHILIFHFYFFIFGTHDNQQQTQIYLCVFWWWLLSISQDAIGVINYPYNQFVNVISFFLFLSLSYLILFYFVVFFKILEWSSVNFLKNLFAYRCPNGCLMMMMLLVIMFVS